MATASEDTVKVVSNRQIAPEYFSMRLVGPRDLARFRPGQFLMLRWINALDPLLSRAMSIKRARPLTQRSEVRGLSRTSVRAPMAEIEILYRVYGRGTARLATMRPGRLLWALGPLGNGFEVPRSVTEVLLVAGGIGVPPLVALAESLAMRRVPRRVKMTAFLGGRSRVDLLCATDLKRVGATIHVATEDGSTGRHGFVTELLEQFLRTPHALSASRASQLTGAPCTAIYACGPRPMLAALASIAERYALPYQASLEAGMACGFGACMSCVVPMKETGRDLTARQANPVYRLVCKSGPVFDGYDVLWTHQR